MQPQVNHTEKSTFFAKLINGLGGTYRRFAPKALPMEADYLHEKAMKKTGLTDFGDPYYREGLWVLLRDFSDNTEESFIGRLAFHNVLIRQLQNRLRFVEYKKNHPEVFSKPLHPPLLITGIQRSGTTFLHRLINEDPQWRSLMLYEVQHPIPPEKDKNDKRLAECSEELKALGLLVPELDSKHLIRADMPEECMWLMGISFCSIEYLLEMPVSDYLEWYLQHDRSKAYAEYAELLQIVQAQAPDKPLLLKSPAHRGSLDYLYEAIPNVRLVITEREAVESASSFSSLIYSVLRNNVKSVDKTRIGEDVMKLISREERRQRAFMEKHPELQSKAHYNQLKNDPLRVVRNIYQHYDIPMTAEAEEKMRSYALTHPQHKYGKHLYSAEDFGISVENMTSHSPASTPE